MAPKNSTKKSAKTPTKPYAQVAAPSADHTDLTRDERELWDFVTATVEPVSLKPRVNDVDELIEPTPKRRASRKPIERKSAKSVVILPSPPQMPKRAPPKFQPATPALQPFDTRKAKKIAKGRQGIDARIDLHGLRQDEARSRLTTFIRRAADNGLSTVLVITGKGREPDDPYMPFGEMLDKAPRGVLRRNVPRWLEEPELRPLIVSWTTAAIQHGGDGALYIHIRKKR
jgi:DNA-nicking Smr family endonuclease